MMGIATVMALAAALADGSIEEAGCLADGSGFLTARLRGAIELDVDWREPQLTCSGMPRPDGRGMRLRFSAAAADGGALAFVFAPPRLAEGEDARAVPVNVTVLQESSGRIYGTRGEERCLLDEVSQRRLPDEEAGTRSWAVEARGFCTVPARSLDDAGTVLLTRFDFRGRVRFGGTAPADESGDADS